jgi:hypothetical protein
MHSGCTQVHEDDLCFGIGIAIGFDPDSDPDSDGSDSGGVVGAERVEMTKRT